MKAIILAAGKSKRFPNKANALVDGSPLLDYSLWYAKSAGFADKDIIVVYKDVKDTRGWGTLIHLPDSVDQIESLSSILAHRRTGNETLMILNVDEIFLNGRFKRMLEFVHSNKPISGAVGFVYSPIQGRTYSIQSGSFGNIVKLTEKPWNPGIRVGTGVYVIKSRVLDYIHDVPVNPQFGERRLVDLMQVAIDSGETFYPFNIADDFVNINHEGDVACAEDMLHK